MTESGVTPQGVLIFIVLIIPIMTTITLGIKKVREGGGGGGVEDKVTYADDTLNTTTDDEDIHLRYKQEFS